MKIYQPIFELQSIFGTALIIISGRITLQSISNIRSHTPHLRTNSIFQPRWFAIVLARAWHGVDFFTRYRVFGEFSCLKSWFRGVIPLIDTMMISYMHNKDHSEFGFSQWETTLHCNVASHWLSPYPEWSIYKCYFISSFDYLIKGKSHHLFRHWLPNGGYDFFIDLILWGNRMINPSF